MSRPAVYAFVKKVKANPEYVDGLLTIDEPFHRVQRQIMGIVSEFFRRKEVIVKSRMVYESLPEQS